MTEEERIAQAVTEGYPDVDENCSECGSVFKNYHHFVRCFSQTCPMKTKPHKSLLDMMREGLHKEDEDKCLPPSGGDRAALRRDGCR